MLDDLFGNTIVLLVEIVGEKADGGVDASVEVISIERMVAYTTQEYATLIMPQVDERGVFFATLMIMFPTKMRPDIALELAAEFFSLNGYSPEDLN